MTMSPRSAVLAGGAVLAAVFAATPAYADAVTVTDETADVWEAVYHSDTDTTEFVSAGSVPNMDVESVRIRHLANRIVVKATYVELKREGVIFGGTSRLRFNDGPTVGFSLDTYNRWGGESVLYESGSGDPIRCGGFDHSIDYAANVVEVSIPRSCVGNPRWVEATYMATGNVEDDTVDGGYRNYRDNGLNAGHSFSGGFSERVRKD
jgi:hypothetical protein